MAAEGAAATPAESTVWGLAGAAGVALLLLFGFWIPPDDATHSLCLLRRATGVACPGCGFVRGVAATVRGDWGAALAFQPLAPLLLAEAVALWVMAGMALKRGAPRLPPDALRVVGDLHLAALVALWLGRTAVGGLP